ncbi:DUF1080 domain-containing protein [Pontibacter korlensis]|uniref:3-keto-disaccharide hydrolase n=1 Tax=Pontibacter korlensis TaxID=400092 RepID=UPI000697F7D8|nr:DUF1080 domain-containing protein [Pontibacter korlensis]
MQQKWRSLFDGETTNGWHSYGEQTAGAAWLVEDKVLHLSTAAMHCDGVKGGDLVTDDSFGDFHVKLEWKVPPSGNSGLLFYVQEEPEKYEKSWQSGPEIQLLDNALHADAMIPKRRAGDLYDLLSATKETVKPAGEWNLTELICKSGKVELYLNGEQTLALQLWDKTWQELIRDSKFKDIPGFGSYKSGKIALQDHGDDVWFRNILICEL